MAAYGTGTYGTGTYGTGTYGVGDTTTTPEPTPDPTPAPGAALANERLEHPVLGVLELSHANGYVVSELNLGAPTVRAVSGPRINASGEDDRTTLTGARVVSFVARCFATDDGRLTRRQVVGRLRAFSNPALRPVLVFAEDDGVAQRVVVRGEPSPETKTPFGTSAPVQMVFVAPSGLIEAYAPVTVEVPAVPAATPGRSYPLSYPRQYPLGTVAGAVSVTSGDEYGASVDHVVQLWGPCTGPQLVNLTTGATLSLPDLVLTGDQYAEVNTAESTIYLNGRRNESLYGEQDWETSSFWQLAPGENQVRYAPTTFEAEARAVITFRPASL